MNALAKKILLIGWDAADWKMITPLVDSGRMPALSKLIEAGCVGNIATLQPCLSPMLWTSIATGKTADQHGVCGFVEPLPDASGVKLVGSTSRKTKAIWNILTQRRLQTHVVSWYASHPAEPINGVCVSDQFCDFAQIDAANNRWPMSSDAVHPPELADSVADLRVRPRDIRAEDLLPFIPRLAEIDPAVDPRPAKLAHALASCASTHAVATAILAREPWDFVGVYYDALDRAGHEFMPYHPPRMPLVSERDFELYSGVMNGLYQFHDMLLARLLELAGDDATVIIVSDHGFHSDHLRPAVPASTEDARAAQWHRGLGMLAMRGPGILRDERIYGASLLDIVPTALALLGLPVGADMPGNVLVQAFDSPPKIDRIASWDSEPGEPGTHPPDKRDDAFASAAAMQQLADLGYLDAVGGDAKRQVDIATREANFNRAIVLLETRKASAAEPILRDLLRDAPSESLPRFAFSLARSLMDQSKPDDAQRVLEKLEASVGAATAMQPNIDAIIAQCLISSGDTQAALPRLISAEAASANQPELMSVIAGAYHSLRRFAEAERAYLRVVQLDPDSAAAQLGLARTLISLSKPEPAVDHALRAIGLIHHFPTAHFALGVALSQLGQTDRAILAIRTAVTMAPNFPEAHEQLAALLLKTGDVEGAMAHRRKAQMGGLKV